MTARAKPIRARKGSTIAATAALREADAQQFASLVAFNQWRNAEPARRHNPHAEKYRP